MRLPFLLILLTLYCGSLQATGPVKPMAATTTAKPKAVLRYDSTHVQVRSFNHTRLNQLKQQPEFQYGETVEQPSLWTRFWRWFWQLFKSQDLKPETSILSLILKYFFIALGITSISFIILKVIGADIGGLFKRKPADASVPYTETFENIHEINFDQDIEHAISQHNYRLAVRLLYLKSLKQLSDAGLIHWQIDKTNSAYINELNNLEQREAFAILTRQFEYIWYGEFVINQRAFQNINTLFSTFKQTLPQ